MCYISAIKNQLGTSDNKQTYCGTEEECECEELCFKRGFPSVCRVMCFAISSFKIDQTATILIMSQYVIFFFYIVCLFIFLPVWLY